MGDKNHITLQARKGSSLSLTTVFYELCLLVVVSQSFLTSSDSLINRPMNLSVHNVSITSAVLTWERESEDDIYYNVMCSEKYNFTSVIKRVYDNNLKIDGLKPNQVYYVILTAVTKLGVSENSDYIEFQTLQSVQILPPSNLRVVTIGSSMVTLEWDKTNLQAAILGYKVFYTTRPELPIVEWRSNDYTGNQQTATIDGLLYNETYYFAVLAYNDYGEGPLSHPLNATIRSAASSMTPQEVSGRLLTANSILVEWRPPTDHQRIGHILGYRVFYLKSEKMPSYTEAQSVEVDRTEATLTDLDTLTEYMIWVLAYSLSGESPKSMPIFVKTHEFVPREPKRIMAHAVNSTTIYVEWHAPRSKVTKGIIRGYYVYYAEVDENNVPIPQTEDTKDTKDGSKTEMVITGLKPNTTYQVTVAGYTHKGDGVRSRRKIVSTKGSVPSEPRHLVVELIIPDPPIAELTWSTPEYTYGRITGYKLYWGRKGMVYMSITLKAYQQSYVTPSLDRGAVYEFRVLASNEIDFGERATVELVVPDEYLVSQLSNFSVLTIGRDMVTLGWDNPNEQPAILGYKVFYTTRPVLPIVLWRRNEYPENQQTATIDGLVYNETYYFVVLAYNHNGQGPLSPILEVTIRPVAPMSEPSNLRVVRFGREWVALEWDKPVVEDIINGYKVYYTTRPESPLNVWNIKLINGTEEKVTINKLVFNETYTFRVAAFNEGREGPVSLALRMQRVKHDKPIWVNTTVLNSTAIFMEWRMPESKHINGRVDGYHVYYEEVDQDDERAPIIRYKVTTEENEMVITGLKHEATYMIRVVGYTIRSGKGMISDSKIERTLGRVPSKPQNLRVFMLDSDLLVANVSWKPPQYSFGPLKAYKLVWDRPGMEQVQTDHFENDTLSYVTPQLDGDTMYRFRVYAENKNGYGVDAVNDFRTPANIVPNEPKRIMAQTVNSTTIYVEWRALRSGIIRGYYVYYAELDENNVPIPQTEDTKDTKDGRKTEMVITGLKPNTTYQVTVAGYTHRGDGVRSRRKIVSTKGSDTIVKKETMSPFQKKVLKLLLRNVDANERIAKELTKTYETVEQMAKSMNAQ